MSQQRGRQRIRGEGLKVWGEQVMKAANLALLVLLAISATGATWKELNSHKGKASAATSGSSPFVRPLDGSLPSGSALRVISIESGSPAALAGFQQGDTLLSLNGATIHTLGQLRVILSIFVGERMIRLRVGGLAGRRDTTVKLAVNAPRLGLVLSGFETGDTLVRIHDDDIDLAGYVRRWGSLTIVRVDVFNRGVAHSRSGPTL